MKCWKEPILRYLCWYFQRRNIGLRIQWSRLWLIASWFILMVGFGFYQWFFKAFYYGLIIPAILLQYFLPKRTLSGDLELCILTIISLSSVHGFIKLLRSRVCTGMRQFTNAALSMSELLRHSKKSSYIEKHTNLG